MRLEIDGGKKRHGERKKAFIAMAQNTPGHSRQMPFIAWRWHFCALVTS
jgi:hypothetical protein